MYTKRDLASAWNNSSVQARIDFIERHDLANLFEDFHIEEVTKFENLPPDIQNKICEILGIAPLIDMDRLIGDEGEGEF